MTVVVNNIKALSKWGKDSSPVSMDGLSGEQMTRAVCALLFTHQNQSQKTGCECLDVALGWIWRSCCKWKAKGILQLNSEGADPGIYQGFSEMRQRLFPGEHRVLYELGCCTLQGYIPILGRGWSGPDLKPIKIKGVSASTSLGWSSVC